MRKIAIYGKGGIGKSTFSSSLAAALANRGFRVMQIGCDPKADSTFHLRQGKDLLPVMDVLQKQGGICSDLNDIVIEGYKGIICVEAGGPTPGSGCAGRGIIKTFNTLDELDAFDVYKPDFVLFDVLGDVVCGGFAVPLREGYADEVIIVTSGEKMALYAAANIKAALDNFRDRGYARLRGVVLNCRDIPDEKAIVQAFVERIGTHIIGIVPRDARVQEAEAKNMTVVEMDDQLMISRTIIAIADSLIDQAPAEDGGETLHVLPVMAPRQPCAGRNGVSCDSECL